MNLLLKYSKQIENLSKLDNVYAVYLFGSYSNKRVKPISDLDVCFFIDEKDNILLDELLSYKTEEFDINVFHKLPLHLQFAILKEGKKLVMNNKEKFREQKLKYSRKYLEEGGILKRLMKKRYGVEI